MSGLVASLKMFFIYGLSSRPQLSCPPIAHKSKELGLPCLKLNPGEPKRTENTPYRPPHLRKKDNLNMKEVRAQNAQSLSDHESSAVDVTSSDSDYSDGDGSLKDAESDRTSKVRIAAITCIQVIFKYLWLSLLKYKET